MLFLHGGPCWPHVGWHDANQRPWENYFTVVQWDQRQAGKTYQSMKKMGPTISRQQFLDDTEEMIAYIRKEFGQQKIFLMGTSYGTFLGMHMVKKHPDWFHAYIGVGQVTTMMTHARGEFDELMAYAKAQGLNDLKAELEALEPYPDPDNTTASFFTHGNVLMDHSSRLGKAYPDSVGALFSMSAMGKWISPLYTLRDNLNRKFGAYFDASHPFADEMMDFDLPNEVGHEFDTPIFFFTGINDFHISYKVTDPWFEKIEAPYKEQVFFNDSAHVPYQTEPGAFVMALANKVLPLAKQGESSHG
jgi:pimeloyl-ACP methyl ester carboxylesterase